MKEDTREFSRFFNGKSIGKSLREIAVDLIKTESDDVVSRWFHSGTNTELFTWVDQAQNIIKQQLSFHGQVVEWNCLEGLKTGFIIELDLGIPAAKNARSSSGIQQQDANSPQSETIQFDSRPMPKAIDLALEILDHIDVEENFRKQLIGNFKDPQHIQSMTPQAFLERFGVATRNDQRQDHGFWENVRRRLHVVFRI